MQQKTHKAIKDYINGLYNLGVASEEEVTEILNRISTDSTQPNKRELLNKQQVAKIAKVHPRTIDRWVAEGKLTKRIIGNNSCRFDSKELERFLFG